MQHNLLGRVLKKTIDVNTCQNDQMVTVSTIDELITYAQISEDDQVSQSSKLGYKSIFSIYDSAFDDTKHFLGQLRYYLKNDTNLQGIENIEKRLSFLIEFFENEIIECQNLLYDYLTGNEETSTFTSAFLLSSVRIDDPSSPYLDRVIVEFAKSKSNQTQWIADGLKLGLHSQIVPRLLLLAELSSPRIQKACLDIKSTHKDGAGCLQNQKNLPNSNSS